MSFPRILPNSSNFPGVIIKFFSESDVRMNFISQMPFQDLVQILFIVGSNPFVFILPEYLSNFGGVSHRHLKTEEEFSSKSCPFSRRFVVLASFILSNYSNCQIFFSYPSGVCQKLISVYFHRRPSFQFSFSSYPGASFKCSLISSSSLRSRLSKSPQAYLPSNSSGDS